MNHKNYCTPEYTQKLVDAGIVLETDFIWYLSPVNGICYIMSKEEWDSLRMSKDYFVGPAPQFQDVWDELPNTLKINGLWYEKRLIGIDNLNIVGYWYNTEVLVQFAEINPTNAAIDLLCWLRKEGK
jgi:hypothetical protein